MDNIERNSKTSKKELRLINTYLQNKHVNRELQTRVRNYLDYMHREEKQLNLEETKVVIGKLSNQLKNELTKEVNSQYIEQFHILHTIFSKKIQEKSLFIMQDHKYTPGEVIFKEGQEDDFSIYLIWEGQIDIYHTNQRDEDYMIQTLTKGSCFGEISFFTGKNRTASARCSEFTSLIKIERQEFIHLIREHSQEDYELFQMINHKIQQSQDYSMLYEKQSKQGKCYTCGSTNHIAKKCTLTHFQPLPVAVIQTAQRSFYQDRINSSRRTRNKWYAREHLNLLKMEDAMQKIEEEYESKLEELNENLLDLSDYDMDQSDQQNAFTRQQTFQERGLFDRQNTGHYMLTSNQEHNDTLGQIRGDYKNMSINIPNNPYLQNLQKEAMAQHNDCYPFKDSKDLKQETRKMESFNNLNPSGFNQNKEQHMRRGSKFLLYNVNTLTQIQEIASPPVIQNGISGTTGTAQSNGFNYYIQQQQQNTTANNSFQNNPNNPMQNLSPKNFTIYNNRKVNRKGTHQSGTYLARRALNKYESQNSPEPNLPRQNTNQVTNGQMVVNEANMNNQIQMKDSYINLVERFDGTISLHIDFMRNFKKYFPDFNISTIEKTHIGKKSLQHSTDSMKKIGSNINSKKQATIKRIQTQKKNVKSNVQLTFSKLDKSKKSINTVNIIQN